jgi:hypothetical protein
MAGQHHQSENTPKEARIGVGRHHPPLWTDLLRQPPRHRPVSSADFQATPAWLNSQRCQTPLRAWVEGTLYEVESLAFTAVGVWLKTYSSLAMMVLLVGALRCCVQVGLALADGSAALLLPADLGTEAWLV